MNRIARRILQEDPGYGRMLLLTAPLYGEDNSYSGYVNQNPRNEMYQQMIFHKPRKEVHTVQDFFDKYVEDDGRTLKH